jgi:hypothetical protein
MIQILSNENVAKFEKMINMNTGNLEKLEDSTKVLLDIQRKRRNLVRMLVLRREVDLLRNKILGFEVRYKLRTLND